MKRSRIKKKKPRYPPDRLIRLRKKWEAEQSFCHVCGADYSRVFCTHHICFKGQAPGRFEHPANWIWICFDCHHYVHNSAVGNEHAKMLACKRLCDPTNFDLQKWLEIAGTSVMPVTMLDIEHALLEGPKL